MGSTIGSAMPYSIPRARYFRVDPLLARTFGLGLRTGSMAGWDSTAPSAEAEAEAEGEASLVPAV